jgi:hypothetical protein
VVNHHDVNELKFHLNLRREFSSEENLQKKQNIDFAKIKKNKSLRKRCNDNG